MALAVCLALVSWLVSRERADQPVATGSGDRFVSAAELRDAVARLPFSVYWAGVDPGADLELVESASEVLVRYIEEGDDEGSRTVVASYSVPDPEGELSEFAVRPGSRVLSGVGGRQLVFSAARPTSVYFADQAGGVQVEVYDPSPARALRLARSARVRPVR